MSGYKSYNLYDLSFLDIKMHVNTKQLLWREVMVPFGLILVGISVSSWDFIPVSVQYTVMFSRMSEVWLRLNR